MANTFDANLSFLSYAIVTEKYNSGQNIIYSFLPLVEKALLDVSSDTISKTELLNFYNSKYGYEMPPAILDLLLNQLKTQNKIEFLKNEQIEIIKKQIEDVSFDYERNTRILQTSFSDFAKNSFGVDIAKEDSLKVIADFIICNALNMNSYIAAIGNFSEFECESTEDASNFEIVVDYLLKIRTENDALYSLIEDIYYGVILSSLLKIQTASIEDLEEDSKLVDAVLLDSNYIFRLLDLQTAYEHQTTKVTHKMLREAGVKIYVLQETLEQFVSTLRKFLGEYSYDNRGFFDSNKSEKFSGICSAMIRRRLSPSDIEELISSLTEILQSEYIDIWDKETFIEENVTSEAISSLSTKKPNDTDEGLVHDIIFVETVLLNRNKPCFSMKDARLWGLTDDLKLCRWCIQNKREYTITPCITEAQINTLFWLKKRNKIDKNGLINSVLAFRNHRLLNLEQYTKIVKAIESQKERFRNNPKKLETLSLVFTESCLSLKDVSEYSESEEQLNITIDNGMAKLSEKMKSLEERVEEDETKIESLAVELQDAKEGTAQQERKAEEYKEAAFRSKRKIIEERVEKNKELEVQKSNIDTELTKYKKWSKNTAKICQCIFYIALLILLIVFVSKNFSEINSTVEKYDKLITIIMGVACCFLYAVTIAIHKKIKKMFQCIFNRIFRIKQIETKKHIVQKQIEENNDMIKNVTDVYNAEFSDK